jgi:hypothetical protein
MRTKGITKIKIAVALTEEELEHLKADAERMKTSISGALRMILEEHLNAK